MTSSRMLRPVLLGLIGFTTTSCGMVEADPHRFETMAEAVADIPLDGRPRPVRTAAQEGLRPALAGPGALRVEVMDPHDLWDARDTGLRGAVERAGPAAIQAAAPVLTEAMIRRAAGPARETVRTTLQLGAFASPAAAERAWSRIAGADHGVADLSPSFESVEVDGRSLTRLKVSAPAEAARAICRAADAAQLGCLRRG